MATAIDLPRRDNYVVVMAEGDDMIRDAIIAEYKRLKLNPYQLWKLVEGQVSRTTIYQFVNDKTTLSTENAAQIMQAMGLFISRKK